MSRLAIADVVVRSFVATVAAVVVIAIAPGGAAAEPPPAGGPALYVAGKMLTEDNLVIRKIGGDGTATEVFKGGAPTSWHWVDARTLVELFDDGSRGDAVIARIVDGSPDPTHSIKIDNTSWPAEAQGWSQYLAVHQGQLWLVREPGETPKPPAKAPAKGRGKAARPAKAAKPAKPVPPVYQRVDVKPPVIQREAPPGGVAARNEGRAWFEGLPSVKPPVGLNVTRAKGRIGRQMLGMVRCKPAKGAMTSYPGPKTHPVLQINVDAVRFVSPTLALYVASGMAQRPEGPRFDTAAFLGCTNEPLHTLAWGGGDVFLTIAGAPGSAGFAAGDPRKMQLWIDGREVAKLEVLLSPVLSPPAAAPGR